MSQPDFGAADPNRKGRSFGRSAWLLVAAGLSAIFLVVTGFWVGRTVSTGQAGYAEGEWAPEPGMVAVGDWEVSAPHFFGRRSEDLWFWAVNHSEVPQEATDLMVVGRYKTSSEEYQGRCFSFEPHGGKLLESSTPAGAREYVRCFQARPSPGEPGLDLDHRSVTIEATSPREVPEPQRRDSVVGEWLVLGKPTMPRGWADPSLATFDAINLSEHGSSRYPLYIPRYRGDLHVKAYASCMPSWPVMPGEYATLYRPVAPGERLTFRCVPYVGKGLPDVKPRSGLLTGGFTTVRSR